MYSGSPVDVINFDFQKAFGTRHKMANGYKIGRVLVESIVSEWQLGHLGGLCWDLFLFLVYISDLDNNVASNILKFVDDTKSFGMGGRLLFGYVS